MPIQALATDKKRSVSLTQTAKPNKLHWPQLKIELSTMGERRTRLTTVEHLPQGTIRKGHLLVTRCFNRLVQASAWHILQKHDVDEINLRICISFSWSNALRLLPPDGRPGVRGQRRFGQHLYNMHAVSKSLCSVGIVSKIVRGR